MNNARSCGGFIGGVFRSDLPFRTPLPDPGLASIRVGGVREQARRSLFQSLFRGTYSNYCKRKASTTGESSAYFLSRSSNDAARSPALA